jgi:hypothetical protein
MSISAADLVKEAPITRHACSWISDDEHRERIEGPVVFQADGPGLGESLDVHRSVKRRNSACRDAAFCASVVLHAPVWDDASRADNRGLSDGCSRPHRGRRT